MSTQISKTFHTVHLGSESSEDTSDAEFSPIFPFTIYKQIFGPIGINIYFPNDSEHPQTINATRTSFIIIETVVEFEGSVGVTELATSLDIPRSTAYKHLKTLCELGYVRKEQGKYRIGNGFTDIGETARADHRLYVTTKPHIDWLAEMTGLVAG